tara:strand:- start:1757 stop:1993 length:237 start_codon:yes stop_codon:yes gene_type:complete
MLNFKVSRVSKHQKNSDNAVSIFTKAITSLDDSQSALVDDIESVQLSIDLAIKEKLDLIEIQSKNKRVLDKIRQFFLD